MQKKRFGKWKKTQEELFMAGLHKYGKNWILIQKIVKTRTVGQVRSHAQKFFTSMNLSEKRLFDRQIRTRFRDFCGLEGASKEKNTMKKSKIDLDAQLQSNQKEFVPKCVEEQELKPDLPSITSQNTEMKLGQFTEAPTSTIKTFPNNNLNSDAIKILTLQLQKANIQLLHQLLMTTITLSSFA